MLNIEKRKAKDKAESGTRAPNKKIGSEQANQIASKKNAHSKTGVYDL